MSLLFVIISHSFSFQSNVGADTVKRGVSPVTLTSSLSNSKLRDSNCSFSKNTSNILDGEGRGSYLVERFENINNISTKNVEFVNEPINTMSSYTTNEQRSTILSHQNSIASNSSTSKLIKRTLSPLIHNQNNEKQSIPNMFNDMKNITNQPKVKPNCGPSMENYYLPSNHAFVNDNNNLDGNKGYLISVSTDTSNTSIYKIVSPPKPLSYHINPIPPPVARVNNQFDSNFLLKTNPKKFASPEINVFNNLNSISTSVNSSSQASTVMTSPSPLNTIADSSYSTNIIYSTLPKSTNSIVTAVANEFEQMIARNACSNNSGMSNTSTNIIGNHSTLSSYRVQYSSTNPFLNNFNSNSIDADHILNDRK